MPEHVAKGLHRAGIVAIVALALVAAGCSTTPRGPVSVLDKKNRASEYTDFGNRAFQQGDYTRALTFFEQALAANLSVDNEPGVIQSLGSLGKVHLAQGDLEGARELLGRASRLAAALQDPAIVLQITVSRAELLLRADDAASARDLLAAQTLPEAVQGTVDLAIYYHTLAVAERKLDSLDSALTHLEAALAINRKIKNLRETASNLIVMASIHTARGEYATAREQALEALELDKQVENSLGIAQDLTALGLVSRRMDLPDDAFRYLERAYGVYQALGHVSGMSGVVGPLAEAARLAGHTAEAP